MKSEDKIILLCIYSKTNQDTLSDDELMELVKQLTELSHLIPPK